MWWVGMALQLCHQALQPCISGGGVGWGQGPYAAGCGSVKGETAPGTQGPAAGRVWGPGERGAAGGGGMARGWWDVVAMGAKGVVQQPAVSHRARRPCKST